MSKPTLIEALAKTHPLLWMDTKQNIHLMQIFPTQEMAIATSLHVARTLAKMLKKTVIINAYYFNDDGEITAMQQAHVMFKDYSKRPAHVSDAN